jgi:hypothetical protein
MTGSPNCSTCNFDSRIGLPVKTNLVEEISGVKVRNFFSLSSARGQSCIDDQCYRNQSLSTVNPSYSTRNYCRLREWFANKVVIAHSIPRSAVFRNPFRMVDVRKCVRFPRLDRMWHARFPLYDSTSKGLSRRIVTAEWVIKGLTSIVPWINLLKLQDENLQILLDARSPGNIDSCVMNEFCLDTMDDLAPRTWNKGFCSK